MEEASITSNNLNDKDSKMEVDSEAISKKQPNVRNIPIFVEGRDIPIINSDANAPISNENYERSENTFKNVPKTSSVFDKVKDFPVRKIIPGLNMENKDRSSPVRNIPINIIHTKSVQPENVVEENVRPPSRSDTKVPNQQPENAISKITKIQNEILILMNQVAKYKGGTKKDKEYLFLDEMLTQNLLKLDTIDTEGKDNIKAARKEAIKCINKCIAALEAKTSDVLENNNSTSGLNEIQNNEQSETNEDAENYENCKSVTEIDSQTTINENECEINEKDINSLPEKR